MRPPSSVPEIVVDKSCRLAGSLCWHTVSGLLYWIDAHAGHLYRYDPASGKSAHVSVEEKALSCTPRSDGSLLVFTADGSLKTLRGDDSSTRVTMQWSPGMQLDAAAVDHQGRLYCAMRSAARRSADLCRVRPDGGIEEAVSGAGRISGLGFDAGSTHLYCCDAVSREIFRFTHDAVNGALTDRQGIAQVPASLGVPRGISMDAKGFIWVPVWGGSCVLRLSPSGKEDRRIYFTAKLLSGLAFGGADLRDLYVISSGAEDRIANGPGAGALYRLRPGLKGTAAALVH